MVNLKEFYEWSFPLISMIETHVYFKNSVKSYINFNPKICILTQVIFLNQFSGHFGLSFPTNVCLLDDFIGTSPWCNVPKECIFKESSSMISDFNSCTMDIKFPYLYDHT